MVLFVGDYDGSLGVFTEMAYLAQERGGNLYECWFFFMIQEDLRFDSLWCYNQKYVAFVNIKEMKHCYNLMKTYYMVHGR